MSFSRTMIYRAVKMTNGKVLVTDPDVLAQTTKIVATEGEYLICKGQGWCDSPQEALDQFEADEAAVSNAAAERAYDDRHMSAPAQAEAAAYEQSVPTHVPVIPEAVKKPRTKKGS